MLKGISHKITPELLYALSEMGHGDEIVLADSNFPAATMGKRVIRCDGSTVCELLDALLPLFPLDAYVDAPIALMQPVPGDLKDEPPIWSEYRAILSKYEPDKKIELVERFAYYERAKKAYCVVQTGEMAIYANLLLKKGVVK